MSKVSYKLTKVNESFTINMYDNGYMIEVGGRNGSDEWRTSKIMVTELEDLFEVIREIISMERAD